jgi:ATP:cob(I)alamin adenosyltransferase
MAEKPDNEKTEKEKRKGYRLTHITTKFGDKGKTYIVGGFVLSKHHPRVRAYGTADELASFIGYTLSKISKDEELKDIAYILKKIQNHPLLFLKETSQGFQNHLIQRKNVFLLK